jgi:hypothetical protein
MVLSCFLPSRAKQSHNTWTTTRVSAQIHTGSFQVFKHSLAVDAEHHGKLADSGTRLVLVDELLDLVL